MRVSFQMEVRKNSRRQRFCNRLPFGRQRKVPHTQTGSNPVRARGSRDGEDNSYNPKAGPAPSISRGSHRHHRWLPESHWAVKTLACSVPRFAAIVRVSRSGNRADWELFVGVYLASFSIPNWRICDREIEGVRRQGHACPSFWTPGQLATQGQLATVQFGPRTLVGPLSEFLSLSKDTCQCRARRSPNCIILMQL